MNWLWGLNPYHRFIDSSDVEEEKLDSGNPPSSFSSSTGGQTIIVGASGRRQARHLLLQLMSEGRRTWEWRSNPSSLVRLPLSEKDERRRGAWQSNAHPFFDSLLADIEAQRIWDVAARSNVTFQIPHTWEKGREDIDETTSSTPFSHTVEGGRRAGIISHSSMAIHANAIRYEKWQGVTSLTLFIKSY